MSFPQTKLAYLTGATSESSIQRLEIPLYINLIEILS
jgi:hypothetical protein